MASRFLIVILALLPTLCMAQSWSPYGWLGDVIDRPTIHSRLPQVARDVGTGCTGPITLSDLSVKPLLGRQTVSLGDHVSLFNRVTMPQVSIAAEMPGWFEVRYLGRTRQTWDETITVDGQVTIGQTVFNRKEKDSTTDSKPKPIDLQWWTQSHQIEATGRTAWLIQPYIVAHFHQLDLTGRTEKLEGTERFEKWFPGIGVAFRVPFVNAGIEAKIAAWQGFSTINLGLRYSPIPYVTVGAEYLREEVWIGNLNHRLDGLVASVGVTF